MGHLVGFHGVVVYPWDPWGIPRDCGTSNVMGSLVFLWGIYPMGFPMRLLRMPWDIPLDTRPTGS